MIGFCVPADAPVGRGDEFIAGELRSVAGRTPVFGIVTKTDLAAPEQIAARLTELTGLMASSREVLPCSAVDGFQVDLLADLLVARLPEGPPLYPDGELTDEPEETLVAELIREAALEGVRDELPHSIAVVIEEMVPREGRRRPARRARQPLRRAVEPEGHRDRSRAASGCARSAPTPAGRSRRCWARGSTSTCTSRSPRTGSATPSSCASSASNRPRTRPDPPEPATHGTFAR